MKSIYDTYESILDSEREVIDNIDVKTNTLFVKILDSPNKACRLQVREDYGDDEVEKKNKILYSIYAKFKKSYNLMTSALGSSVVRSVLKYKDKVKFEHNQQGTLTFNFKNAIQERDVENILDFIVIYLYLFTQKLMKKNFLTTNSSADKSFAFSGAVSEMEKEYKTTFMDIHALSTVITMDFKKLGMSDDQYEKIKNRWSNLYEKTTTEVYFYLEQAILDY